MCASLNDIHMYSNKQQTLQIIQLANTSLLLSELAGYSLQASRILQTCTGGTSEYGLFGFFVRNISCVPYWNELSHSFPLAEIYRRKKCCTTIRCICWLLCIICKSALEECQWAHVDHRGNAGGDERLSCNGKA
ncbi:hypothetical protein Tcan_01384, partial [Toxocara canis]